jgi:hypothetical protein
MTRTSRVFTENPKSMNREEHEGHEEKMNESERANLTRAVTRFSGVRRILGFGRVDKRQRIHLFRA